MEYLFGAGLAFLGISALIAVFGYLAVTLISFDAVPRIPPVPAGPANPRAQAVEQKKLEKEKKLIEKEIEQIQRLEIELSKVKEQYAQWKYRMKLWPVKTIEIEVDKQAALQEFLQYAEEKASIGPVNLIEMALKFNLPMKTILSEINRNNFYVSYEGNISRRAI